MQQPQPNFRYGSTPNYLAQLTGHDPHNSQARSTLPVEQLDTGLQHRQLPGQPGYQGPGMPPHRGSPQPDVLTYPSSSLAHFQQMLQAQAGNAQGLGTSMPTSAVTSAPLQSLSQPMLQALHQMHQGQPPKPASGKSNRDPNQSNHDPNIDSSQPMLSPRYVLSHVKHRLIFVAALLQGLSRHLADQELLSYLTSRVCLIWDLHLASWPSLNFILADGLGCNSLAGAFLTSVVGFVPFPGTSQDLDSPMPAPAHLAPGLSPRRCRRRPGGCWAQEGTSLRWRWRMKAKALAHAFPQASTNPQLQSSLTLWPVMHSAV